MARIRIPAGDRVYVVERIASDRLSVTLLEGGRTVHQHSARVVDGRLSTRPPWLSPEALHALIDAVGAAARPPVLPSLASGHVWPREASTWPCPPPPSSG